MLDFIRRFRLLYEVYNFFHRRQLVHNLPLYKKYGLRKRYYSPVSSRDFSGIAPADQTAGSLSTLQEEIMRALTSEDRASLQDFDRNGYAILRHFFDDKTTDQANAAIAGLLEEGKVKFRYGRKIMFAFKKAGVLRKMGEDPRLTALLAGLLGTRPVLFQSINFLQGSEQHTHSDSIHMTTFPLGRLIAVWVALEDITEENGPLHYYPGSQQLPYYLNSDYGNEGNRWLLGNKSYGEYEQMIERKIAESGLKKERFVARKGDVLIWHANLFHGGEPHRDKTRSRKSMVFHYFGEDAICYHEITQRPALMEW